MKNRSQLEHFEAICLLIYLRHLPFSECYATKFVAESQLRFVSIFMPRKLKLLTNSIAIPAMFSWPQGRPDRLPQSKLASSTYF